MATPASEWRQPQRGARAVIVFAVGLLAALALAWWLRELVLLIYASVLFAIVIDPLVGGSRIGGGGSGTWGMAQRWRWCWRGLRSEGRCCWPSWYRRWYARRRR